MYLGSESKSVKGEKREREREHDIDKVIDNGLVCVLIILFML